jgi:hypothetical protein
MAPTSEELDRFRHDVLGGSQAAGLLAGQDTRGRAGTRILASGRTAGARLGGPTRGPRHLFRQRSATGYPRSNGSWRGRAAALAAYEAALSSRRRSRFPRTLRLAAFWPEARTASQYDAACDGPAPASFTSSSARRVSRTPVVFVWSSTAVPRTTQRITAADEVADLLASEPARNGTGRAFLFSCTSRATDCGLELCRVQRRR